MSIALAGIKGLTYYDSRRAFPGVTLLTPLQDTGVWMIDMYGEVVKHWETGYSPGMYGELLPNGHLLYHGKLQDGPLADLEGAGGALLEFDGDGHKVWEYQDLYLHHGFYRMENGNTLVIRWVEVPKHIASRIRTGAPEVKEISDEIAAKVKNAGSGTERNNVTWGDAIQEVTCRGDVVWEWIGHEHLDPEIDRRCVFCRHSEWTHANSISELPDGNILVSFSGTHTIAVIDKRTGDIRWRWGGCGMHVGHPHSATMLDDGDVLFFDNGLHYPAGWSKVVEIDPKLSGFGEEVWIYPRSPMTEQFTSSTMSNCQRLPNGNTFICEGEWGRLFEVTPAGELCWEWVNNLPFSDSTPKDIKPLMVTAAFRYGIDYPGLRRSSLVPYERQKMPGMRQIASDVNPISDIVTSPKERILGVREQEAKLEEEKTRRRLEQLGYF